MNQEGLIKIIDKFVKQDKAQSIAERSARAAAQITNANVQKESVSPRLAAGDKDQGPPGKGKYKQKSKSNNRISTRPNNTNNDYDYPQDSNRDNKSPSLHQGKTLRKITATGGNSRASNSEGGRGNIGSRINESQTRKRQRNESENDADMEDGYSSADDLQNKANATAKKQESQPCPITKVLSMSNIDL